MYHNVSATLTVLVPLDWCIDWNVFCHPRCWLVKRLKKSSETDRSASGSEFEVQRMPCGAVGLYFRGVCFWKEATIWGKSEVCWSLVFLHVGPHLRRNSNSTMPLRSHLPLGEGLAMPFTVLGSKVQCTECKSLPQPLWRQCLFSQTLWILKTCEDRHISSSFPSSKPWSFGSNHIFLGSWPAHEMVDTESPAAGAYRRGRVSQRGRPWSPSPAQLPGCVPGLAAPGALVFDWEAGGTPVQRPLRSSSPNMGTLVLDICWVGWLNLGLDGSWWLVDVLCMLGWATPRIAATTTVQACCSNQLWGTWQVTCTGIGVHVTRLAHCPRQSLD